MKKGNLIFGMALAVAAIGSAAAHVLLVNPVYVHGSPYPTGSAICTQLESSTNVCSINAGTINCKVLVELTTASGPATQYTIGYSDSGCSTKLKQQNANSEFDGIPTTDIRVADTYVAN